MMDEGFMQQPPALVHPQVGKKALSALWVGFAVSESVARARSVRQLAR